MVKKFENLTDAQKEKLSKCKTPEDILELAKSEGYTLSDEELEIVNGGVKLPSKSNYNLANWKFD
ncbi:MAG: Nif11-like leader peptide family natural product precursor [Atopobiaceae bacterium]|nr:Nif11-like leader peptide family natural product precursor [Atopobiaceae bacterium]